MIASQIRQFHLTASPASFLKCPRTVPLCHELLLSHRCFLFDINTTNSDFKGFHIRGFDSSEIFTYEIQNCPQCACAVLVFLLQVYLSVGKGTYIVPRLLGGGQPLGYVTQRRSNIRNKKTLGNVVCAIANSRLNHSAAGITSADKVPDLTQMINDLIYHQIACGRVKIAGRLVSVGENEAELEDGTVLRDIDAILFATGYRRGQSFLSDEARGGK